MRKLATVQIIKEVVQHPNADLLEIAKINGWQCVVKIGEFKAGERGVYFEIDSFLPASDERFEFLNNKFVTFENTQGARIRTIKLRGELSQGLVLPISLFPELDKLEVGDDATEMLGVLKYEKAVGSLSHVAKGNFPSFIEKTDQERVQNLTRLDRSGEWEQTEKMDGSSLTVYANEGAYGVCSRNLELKEDGENGMWGLAKKLNLEERLQSLGRNIALQGEMVGPKIQGNRYKLDDYAYFVFDVYDIDAKRKMLPKERTDVLEALNAGGGPEIRSVPILGTVRLPQGEEWMQELIASADGQSVIHSGAIREGFVFKRTDKNESFKVISNKFLLKYDE